MSHQLLLFKLSKLNLDPNVLKWIESFLYNRTQYVTVNDNDSDPHPVTSGVPQGSVLAPLLFLIYINDLTDSISSSIRLFADDCVIYRKITNPTDVACLQADLDNISTWCDRWMMKLNANKCKSMRISRKTNHQDPDYFLSDVPLSPVKDYKYLGVYISNDLTWHTHIQYITNNANRMLGFIRRNFSLAPTSVKLLLYKTLVRSKVEYASSVWDTPTNTLISTLESLQNRATRFILSNYSRFASVTQMKSTLHLPHLSVRRQISRISLFHKIFYTNVDLKEALFTRPHYLSSRIDHHLKVGIPQCRTNLFYDSFVPRTSRDWNHLPASVVSIIDHSTFKSALLDCIT